jgi:hypothetical protein
MLRKRLRAARASGELHHKSLAHEGGTIYTKLVRETSIRSASGRDVRKAGTRRLAVSGFDVAQRRTRNDVTGIHGILVLNEAEAIHELDFGDFAVAMLGKVSLQVSPSSYSRKSS